MKVIEADWYDYPQYFDLAFRDETRQEAGFFVAAFAKYARIPVRRVLEPACGGGRLVVDLARRGYQVVAFDRSAVAVRYVRRRLKRSGLAAEVFQGDMLDFGLSQPVDAAFNTWNTFRHLLTEREARKHLELVAEHLRPGGLFILGLHLLPPDADEQCTERWTAQHAGTRVTVTLRVVDTDRRRRIERIRISMRVRSRRQDLRIRHEFALRMYTAAQIRRLLQSVPALELCDVYDFWYDIDDPLELNDDIADTVFVLRRR